MLAIHSQYVKLISFVMNIMHYQGNYNGPAPYLISPLMAISDHPNTEVTYALGCDIDSEDTEGFAAALAAVSGADATVLVMGLDQSQEKEGHDR
jgi:xylan 1,4-beta-xylosidase